MSDLHPLLEKNTFQRLEASLATIKKEQKIGKLVFLDINFLNQKPWLDY